MNILEYLKEKYDVEVPTVLTATEARFFGVKYPLTPGWLEKVQDIKITPYMAERLADKLISKAAKSNDFQKARYSTRGAAILLRIAKEALA